MLRIFLILILLIFFNEVSSQTCCSGGVPVSNNIGFQSSDQGTWHISLNADFNVLKTLKNEAETLQDDLRLRTTQSYIFRSAYAVTDRISIESFVPFIRQTRRITTNSGSADRQSTFGLGDPLLMGVADLIKSNWVFRVGLGAQLPLGSFSQRDARGVTLLEDMQPGSGAWDIVLFQSTEIPIPKRPSALIFINTIVTMTGTNDQSRNGSQEYEFGNDLQLIAGYSDQFVFLNQIISPGVSIRYRNVQRDRIDNNPIPGTGGEFFFARLSTGIPFPKLTSNFTINLEFPIHSRVNETQLVPSYIINFGWTKTIEPSSSLTNLIDIK